MGVDAEPNMGVDWNRIVKRVAAWRGKWAVKLRKYIEEVFPTELAAKPLNREVELLLQGEDPYAAMTAAHEAEAAEMAGDGEIKEEDGGVKGATFDPSPSFTGARPGWCFKMGPRGLGYYRDKVQDIKMEKTTVIKDEDEQTPKVEK